MLRKQHSDVLQLDLHLKETRTIYYVMSQRVCRNAAKNRFTEIRQDALSLSNLWSYEKPMIYPENGCDSSAHFPNSARSLIPNQWKFIHGTNLFFERKFVFRRARLPTSCSPFAFSWWKYGSFIKSTEKPKQIESVQLWFKKDEFLREKIV